VIIGTAPYQNAPAYVLAFATSHLAQAPGFQKRLYELATSPDWELAKRDRFGDAAGFLRDVDLAIAAAMATPRQLASVAGACVVYARQMAIGPAPVISVIAKTGQLQRAELMAGNIVFAVERCWAYASIAPTLHAERDVAGALRCLAEAERAISAINVTHAAMAWSWVAEAAMECGLKERALMASRRAAETRAELSPSTEWELPNVFFWAGLAARRVGDEETRSLLREELRNRISLPGRNQALQAAAVLGDTDYLRTAWGAWVGGERGGIVRAGNLALALADSGMTVELEEMLALPDYEQLAMSGEADSRKHLAWALAIIGRFDQSFRVLASIEDTEHWVRALARIVGEARKLNDSKALAAATTLVDKIDTFDDERSRTISVTVLHDLQQEARALLIAEEIIGEGLEPSAASSVAFPEPDYAQPGGWPEATISLRTKTARRHLHTKIAALPDESAADDVIALAREKKLQEARARLPLITVPRFRWNALREMAANTADAAEAVDLWCDALLDARRVNEPAARTTAAMLAMRLLELPQGDYAAEQISTNVQAITKAWTEAEVGQQYELLRELLRPGRGRTQRMEELIATAIRSFTGSSSAEMKSLAPSLLWGSGVPPLWSDHDVDDLIDSGQAGKRMFACVLMQSFSSFATVDRVIRLISSSLSAFEQYHALAVGLKLAPGLSALDGARLREAILLERSRYITQGTDRFQLTVQILDALS
jgi:hypothetical protein